MSLKKIVVNDRMQQGYEYELSEPVGENLSSSFQPELSPKKLLAMGVFGGKYLNDCRDEFPASWFDSAKLNPEKSLAEVNFFGVHASKPLSYWREKGWIAEQDPRGWFQWYCRYFLGRRSEDDQRQIGRWRAMRRHIGQLQANCVRGDLLCRPRQRQALLHWAYDSRNY